MKKYLNKVTCCDCLEGMKNLPDGCIDTIISDPPYGLSFMGKKWDYDLPSIEVWLECLRVLKPGGTALIFGGSRSYHRLACRVEDAGFVLKDCIMWIYGSGFPKATDVSKQLDKVHGKQSKGFNTSGGKEHYEKQNKSFCSDYGYKYKPQKKEAQLWHGWKSHGLKPAYEPIMVCMKPNEGSYAENAFKHGVSGLNIDGGRIKIEKLKEPDNRVGTDYKLGEKKGVKSKGIFGSADNKNLQLYKPESRFPANIILDAEAAAALDEQSGVKQSSKGGYDWSEGEQGNVPITKNIKSSFHFGDTGGASRFFYCAKASQSERNDGLQGMEAKPYKMHRPPDSDPEKVPMINKNNHPTVKPLSLMKYLCTLTATPTGGIVLDPFIGSGTTAVAAIEAGRQYIGMELSQEHCDIAEKRIAKAMLQRRLF